MALINGKQLADALGLTPKEFKQLTEAGVIPKPAKRGKYEFIAALQGYVQHLRENLEPAETKPGPVIIYKPEYCATAKKLCELGATDGDLAEAFGVNRSTIYRWRVAEMEFREACQVGKTSANERVERSLYERANGYTYDAVKVFLHKGKAVYAPYKEHVPPDVAAGMSWLTNRDPDNWQHRHQHEHTGPNRGPIQVINTTMTLQEMASEYARMIGNPEANFDDEESDMALLEQPVNPEELR